MVRSDQCRPVCGNGNSRTSDNVLAIIATTSQRSQMGRVVSATVEIDVSSVIVR